MKLVKAKQIVIEAKKLINVPFCNYGRTTLGLDCSGLIWLVFHRCGIDFPRLHGEKYSPFWWRDPSQGERLLDAFLLFGFEICDEPVIGGIVLFRLFGDNVPVNHCGILINEDHMIHAKCSFGGRKNKKVSPDCLIPGYIKRLAYYLKHKDVDYGDDYRTNNR